MPCSQLYVITDPKWCPDHLIEAYVQAALQGGAGWIQYRDKRPISLAKKVNICKPLRRACVAANAQFVVNDDINLAKALNTHIHLGQTDTPIALARKKLGQHVDFSITCHQSLTLAREAISAGTDHIAFGAMYPSQTKPTATLCDLSILTQARTLLADAKPNKIIAIGGIQTHNLSPVLQAGADIIAVCQAIWSAPCIKTRCKEFIAAISASHGLQSSDPMIN